MYYVPDGTKECGFYECKKVRQSIPVPADDEKNPMPGLRSRD